jgi:hypothetical protein
LLSPQNHGMRAQGLKTQNTQPYSASHIPLLSTCNTLAPSPHASLSPIMAAPAAASAPVPLLTDAEPPHGYNLGPDSPLSRYKPPDESDNAQRRARLLGAVKLILCWLQTWSAYSTELFEPRIDSILISPRTSRSLITHIYLAHVITIHTFPHVDPFDQSTQWTRTRKRRSANGSW